MVNTSKTITIGCFAMMLLLCGCSHDVSYVAKYGVACNLERENLGIPTIPTNWTVQDMGSYFDCFDPSPNQTIPYRLLKRVFIKGGVIEKETDTFYSGKTFFYPPEQITLPQQISIEYDYLPDKGTNPWKVYADLNASERFKPISIEQARQILTSWGLWKSAEQIH